MRKESSIPADTPFLSAASGGLLYNASILYATYANWTRDTLCEENLAHIVMSDKFVTSQIYSTELSPPIPSDMSADARYVLYG